LSDNALLYIKVNGASIRFQKAESTQQPLC